MPDLPFTLGQGQLEAARQALLNRGGQLQAQEDAAMGGPAAAGGGAIMPPPAAGPLPPAQAQAPNGRMIAGQALMAGANALAPRPMVTPQQQAQLVQLLRARMASQQAQQPPQPPQPPQPSPMGVPMMSGAAPIPGMTQ